MRAKKVDTRDSEAHYYLHNGETWLEMLSRVNWVSTSVLLITPLVALYGLLTVSWCWQTALLFFYFYLWTGLGVTAGYHRMWSHRAYYAAWPIRFWLMLGGSGAAQGSIRWWSRNHRIHHRYTDTPQDPYNARQGLFYSHFGWMLFTKDYAKIEKPKFDITDLERDPMIMFQNKYYGVLALFIAIVLPTLIAGLGWGDWLGGYFLAGVLRLVFVHHGTFCVNSLAHWLGSQPFADDHTPKDHFLTAIVTLGEGYHNFHHEFPYDFRNGVQWYQYDPTKWFVLALYRMGLAWDLREFGTNEIQMGVWQMKLKTLHDEKSKHLWPPSDTELPHMDWWEFQGRVHNAEKLIVVDRYVLKLADFMPQHPGGSAVLTQHIGKDASKEFHGVVHEHSLEAEGLASLRRIAIIKRLPDEASAQQKGR
jgi:stearoyl-CoA desaturase (delta-9 desaturase)